MSAEKIQDALNLLPDDLILETDALRQQKQKKPLVLKRLLPVAACFVLVVGTLLITAPWLNRKSAESAMDQMAAAEAPMEYGEMENGYACSDDKFPDRELNEAMGQGNTVEPEEEKTTMAILLTAPPELVIRDGDRETTVASGEFRWEYLDEEGMKRGTMAGMVRPMSKWQGDVILNTNAAELELSWSFLPDSVTVRCYSNERSSETWNVEFPAELEENVLTLNPECEIYVITALWDNNGSWGGEATYAIYVQHPE